MKREINITNSKSKVIEQYYTLVNPLLGKNKLGPVQIKVLSKMALVYNNYIHLGEEIANTILFSRKTNSEIRAAVSKDLSTTFTQKAHSNIVMHLKRNGVITNNKILYLPPIKDNKIELSIILNIRNDDE